MGVVTPYNLSLRFLIDQKPGLDDFNDEMIFFDRSTILNGSCFSVRNLQPGLAPRRRRGGTADGTLRKKECTVKQPRCVALPLLVWPLADQRSQSHRPRKRHGSGVEALLVVTRLVIECAGQRHTFFPT